MAGKAGAQGLRHFHARRWRGAPDAAKIIDGKYALKTTAGKKRVEIHASRRADGPPDPMMGELPATPYIPARFNAKSISPPRSVPMAITFSRSI